MGTTYSSPYAFFTTLRAPTLLGASSMQWTPPPTQNFSKALSSQALFSNAATTTNPAANVPVFAYTRTLDETSDTLTIEVSTDAVNWADTSTLSEWSTDLTSSTITAQWISTTSPPARAFFRVARP